VKPLIRAEILDPQAYEPVRDGFRRAIIELKKQRRLGVGDRVTLVFENRETLRFQVQEMLRVERIRDPAGIQLELDVYNELMPGPDELSATLFIEITEAARIKPELDRMVGLDEHVSLVLGEGEAERLVPARFDPDQMEEERISAVQYVRFGLSPEHREQLADLACRARVRIDHAAYQAEAELFPRLRESLLADLCGDPAPLLSPPPAHDSPAPVTLHETERLRTLQPAASSEAHVIVELKDAAASLLNADLAVLTEALDEVRRVASELSARHGGCLVNCDVQEQPVRWHLRGRPR